MLEVFGATDTGRVRSNNQDAYRLLPELGLYLLADGMGGARGGERASQIAVETVADVVRGSEHRDAATLLGAVEEANTRVLREATRDPLLDGMGTTIVAALETGPNDVAIASVGDSRAYLFDGKQLRAITEDQTWVQEVGKPLGLDDESLRTHPMRHVLTMAVGVNAAVTIRYYAVQLRKGDIMMLSSDGLHGVVETAEMEHLLSHEGSLPEKCQALVNAAHSMGSPDNVTLVLIRAAKQ